MCDLSYRAPTAPVTRNRRCAPVRTLLLAGAVLLLGNSNLAAYTPESPEVRAVIEKSLAYLEVKNDRRLGGKCLVALAFYKAGVSKDHPRIQEALEGCLETDAATMRQDTLYGHALAIILLAEVDPVKYREKIDEFSGAMAARQKSHGGWGYDAFETGDTSQTQYAVLSYWQLMQIGMPPQVGSVEKAANWLLRTQDPSGAWGYQGQDPGSFQLREQTQTSLSMLAAGLGSTLICANIMGVIEPGKAPGADASAAASESQVPSALREVQPKGPKAVKQLSGGSMDKEQLAEAMQSGQAYFDKNFHKHGEAEYPYYVLYSIERYKSFEEFLTGNVVAEPEWYNEGFEYIRKKQAKDGSFSSQAGPPCATAFAVLFLVRSTQQSIKASMGEGTLVGGRGLTANLARMKLKNGRLVAEKQPTHVDKFLEMLETEESGKFESLMAESSVIDVENITSAEIRRLEQLVKTGGPEARLLAVQALGKLRSLDYVPSLLHALTDPDKRVVRAARDGLMYVSRRFKGFGPDDNFTEREQYDAHEAWKNWYRRVQPDAVAAP